MYVTKKVEIGQPRIASARLQCSGFNQPIIMTDDFGKFSNFEWAQNPSVVTSTMLWNFVSLIILESWTRETTDVWDGDTVTKVDVYCSSSSRVSSSLDLYNKSLSVSVTRVKRFSLKPVLHWEGECERLQPNIQWHPQQFTDETSGLRNLNHKNRSNTQQEDGISDVCAVWHFVADMGHGHHLSSQPSRIFTPSHAKPIY